MNHGVPQIDVAQIPLDTNEAPHLLDVREDDEWAAGHIESAQHIPMMQVPARLTEIPTDAQVLVICRSGSRSARVVGFLQAQGIDAVNVAGGMHDWATLGRPMTGAPGQPPQVI